MNVFESLYFKKKRKAKTSLFPLTCFQPSPNPFSLILFLSRGPNSLLLFFFRPETVSPPAQFSSPARSFFLAQSVAPSPLSLADVRGPPVRASFLAVAEQDSAPSPLPRAPPGLSWPARQGIPGLAL